jgi:hypothetical protein
MRAPLLLALVAVPALAGPPPPPMPQEERPLGPIVEALSKNPGDRAGYAVARWYQDVQGVKTVSVPKTAPNTFVGTPPEASARAIARCELPKSAEAKATAAKLLGEYGDALPLKLKAIALASGGKPADATKALLQMVEQTAPKGPCRPEHPATTQTRLTTLDDTEACLRAFDPKADVAPVRAAKERVQQCARSHPPMPG